MAFIGNLYAIDTRPAACNQSPRFAFGCRKTDRNQCIDDADAIICDFMSRQIAASRPLFKQLTCS